MPGETNLNVILEELSVIRRPGRFAVVAVEEPPTLTDGVEALVAEADRTTVVATVERAEQSGWQIDFEAAWLTLDVHSSLEAVGLTAAAATALAERSIPCNVLAGWKNDHILVPVAQAEAAIAALSDIANHSHGHHSHGHDHGHGHGHGEDQGISGFVRYLRFAPKMWRSSLNTAVVKLLQVTPRETVVDIGAGMGAGSTAAARRSANVLAVEPTPALRNVLNVRRLAPPWRDFITVVDGAAEAIPLGDAKADAVMAVNTMHHWTDPDQASAEIARVLRPDGRFVLVDEDFEDPTHPDFERFAEHGGRHGFTMVDADAMAARFRRVGITDVTAERRHLDKRPVIAVTGRTPT
ncbi:MAG: methyltransferase domain-containing protein [Acidimicrobiales bacterium]